MKLLSQVTPYVVVDDGDEFLEWMASAFDAPVREASGDSPAGRLRSRSASPVVLDSRDRGRLGVDDFEGSNLLELRFYSLDRAVDAALAYDADLVVEPSSSEDGDRFAVVRTPQGMVLQLTEVCGGDAGRAELELNSGPIDFNVGRPIDAEPDVVFDAVSSAEHLERFFVEQCEGTYAAGEIVEWFWGALDAELHIREFRPPEYLAFDWRAVRCPYRVRTQFNVRPHDRGAELSITESGWNTDPAGLDSAFVHCDGWSEFADNLRVYLEHDVELASGNG